MDEEEMVHRVRIVPWLNTEQFIQTYHNLYSDNICKQRAGVDQVSVWRTRCHPSLPKAIEATVGLVRTIIQETLYLTRISPHEELDIRMIFSTALTRFVTLILEPNEDTDETSLYDLAAKHNLPTWVIDLRNDAVHSYMPTRSMLRYGIDIALSYLKETYWVKEITNKTQIKYSITGLEMRISKQIEKYKDLQFRKIIEFLDEEQREIVDSGLKDVLKKFSFYLYHCGDIFMDILAEPENFTSFEVLDTLLNSKGSRFLEQPNFIIPYKLQKFWFPLLRELHREDLLPDFLDKILLAQKKTRNRVSHKLAIAWSLEIFAEANSKSILTPLFLQKGILMDKVKLAYCCALSPHEYSKDLLLRIIETVPEPQKEIYGNFCYLVAMVLGKFVGEPETRPRSKSFLDEIIFTMKDVEEQEEELRKRRMPAERGDVENNWSKASAEIDFSKIPIGAYINTVELPKVTEDLRMKKIKLEPSVDDDFIFGENVDPNDVMDEPDSTEEKEMPLPANFDVVYRPNPKE